MVTYVAEDPESDSDSESSMSPSCVAVSRCLRCRTISARQQADMPTTPPTVSRIANSAKEKAPPPSATARDNDMLSVTKSYVDGGVLVCVRFSNTHHASDSRFRSVLSDI